MKKINQSKINKTIQKKVNHPFLEKLTHGFYPYLIIITLGLAIYGQSLDFGFVHLDDDIMILSGKSRSSSVSELISAFGKDAYFNQQGGNYYRPGMLVSLIIDTAIGGGKPWAFHFSSLVLHCAVACLLFYLTVILRIRKEICLLLATIFISHPLLVNSVAWIPARNDLLIGFFGILSFIFLVKFLHQNRILLLIFHILFLLFAFFSKESALALPFVFMFYLLFAVQQLVNKKNISLIIIGWFILYLFFFIMKIRGSGSALEGEMFAWTNILTNYPVLTEVFFKSIIPVKLSVLPVITPALSLLGLAAFVIIMILISKYTEKPVRMKILFGLLWFAAVMFPSLFITYKGGRVDYFEIRAYLPVIGAIIALGFMLNSLKEQNRSRVNYLIILVTIIFSIYSFSYSKNFRAPEEFFTSAVNSSPDNPFGYYGLGTVYKDNEEWANAEKFLSQAIKINPDYSEALNNLGIVEHKTNNFTAAIELYRRAAALRPYDSKLYFNLGNAFFAIQQYDSAKTAYERSISINPKSSEVFNNLGSNYVKQGQFLKAIEYFRKSIEIDSLYASPYKNMGVAYGKLGDTVKRIEAFRNAARLGAKDIAEWLKRNGYE